MTSGDQPQVLEVTSDDDLSLDIIFGHLSPREGPNLTQTFPRLWQIILIILFLSPRLDAVHQNFWSLWKDHHIILKRSTWHLPAVPMLRHQNWSRHLFIGITETFWYYPRTHAFSTLDKCSSGPDLMFDEGQAGRWLVDVNTITCCGSNVQYIEIIVSRITFYQHHDKNIV